MPQRKPKAEIIEANPEPLKKFGWIATIDSMSGGDVTKWNATMSVSFERMIVKIQLDAEREEFQERLREVLKSKQDK